MLCSHLKAVCEEALRTGSQAGFRLDAVVFGGEDFRASIGCYLHLYYKCLCMAFALEKPVKFLTAIIKVVTLESALYVFILLLNFFSVQNVPLEI